MGGKRPRQSHGVSVLPDDAGVASVAERHTRGTGVLRLSKMTCAGAGVRGASPAQTHRVVLGNQVRTTRSVYGA